jgi:SAM-dependent methyltransferase
MDYRTDIEYMTLFNNKQAPVVLNYVAALNGLPIIDLNVGFRYCDLGCGSGLTLTTLAAAYPQGEFWGVDFNANHIRMGRARVEATGLTNVKFVEASFTRLKDLEFPKFDFVAINGTLSWLEAEPRNGTLDFMEDNLQDGGLGYLHYMSMPGHMYQPPICRLASDYYNQLTGDLEEKVFLTKEFLRGFLQTQKQYFEQSPPAKGFIQRMLDSGTSLFLHDYLSNAREAYYFDDIDKMMRQRNCYYAGSAEFFCNHLQLVVPLESRDLFRGVRDRSGIESIKDFVGVTGGRTDVFVKSSSGQPPSAKEDPLENMIFGGMPFPDNQMTINFSGTVVQLGIEPAASLIRVLKEKPRSLAELYKLDVLAAYGSHDIRKALTQAIAARKIEPFVQIESKLESKLESKAKEKITGDSSEISRSHGLSKYNFTMLNDAVHKETPDRTPSITLASSMTGNGIAIRWIDAAILLGLVERPLEEVPKWVTSHLAQKNLRIQVNVQNTEDEKGAEEFVKMLMPTAVQTFAHTIGYVGLVQLPSLAEVASAMKKLEKR